MVRQSHGFPLSRWGASRTLGGMFPRPTALLAIIAALGAGEADPFARLQPGVPSQPAPRVAPSEASPTAPPADAAAVPTTPATPPGSDQVFLTNRQRILGVIDDTAPAKDDRVSIKLRDGGVIRVRRELIKSEERGYDSRRQSLKAGDFAGALELAKWCIEKDKKSEALEALETALGWAANAPSPAALLEARALHAQLVDELRGPEAALPLYQAYRDAGGKDADTLSRLAQLEEAVRQYQAQNQPAAQPEATTGAPVARVRDILEGRKWDPESPQWSNPIEAKNIDVDTVAGKNRILDVTFKGDPNRKGARVDKSAIRRAIPTPIGDATTFSYYVRNLGDRPVRMTVGVKTGDWVFHESSMQTVPAKSEWVLLSYDLTASTFKSEATSWDNNGTVANLDQIKEMQILIYHGQNEGHLQLDQIEFVPPTTR